VWPEKQGDNAFLASGPRYVYADTAILVTVPPLVRSTQAPHSY